MTIPASPVSRGLANQVAPRLRWKSGGDFDHVGGLDQSEIEAHRGPDRGAVRGEEGGPVDGAGRDRVHRHDDPITGDTPHDPDPTAGDTYSGTPAMSRRVAAVGSTCNRVRFESTMVRILAIVDASAGDARKSAMVAPFVSAAAIASRKRSRRVRSVHSSFSRCS